LLILSIPGREGTPLSLIHAVLAISEKILYSFPNPDKLELTSLNREGAKGAKNSLILCFKQGKLFCLPLRSSRLSGKDLFPVEKNCIL
jgi:hypothetical protein